MQRRGTIVGRSRREWIVRGSLGAAALALGWFNVARALGSAVAKANIELAHRLAPNDARITAMAAAARAGLDASPADRAVADDLARYALRQDPTAVLAASTLGIDAQVRGNRSVAARLFRYAEVLSRRDLQTQLWAIEDAVGRGDVNGALRHYDVALRTTPQASELLYPVLASAAAEPPVRAALVRTLARKPIWADTFLTFIAGRGPDPQTAARVFTDAWRSGIAVPPAAASVIVDALVAKGMPDQAWTFYRTFRPETDPRRSRDPHFGGRVETASIFDWRPVNDAGVSTSVRSGVFDFAAPASVGGVLLQQLQLLPPGTYRLDGHGSGINQPDNVAPYWTLRCQDGIELGRVTVPPSGRMGSRFGGTLVVPARCVTQMLTFVAPATDAMAGLSGQLDRVQLAPIAAMP